MSVSGALVGCHTNDQIGIEQDKMIRKVEYDIEQVFGSLDEFYKVGFWNLTKGGRGVIVGFSKDNEKTKALMQRIEKSIPSKLLTFKSIEYSHEEMLLLSDKVWEKLKDLNIDSYESQSIELSVDTENQKLKLRLNHLSKENKKALKDEFGKILEVKVNKFWKANPT